MPQYLSRSIAEEKAWNACRLVDIPLQDGDSAVPPSPLGDLHTISMHPTTAVPWIRITLAATFGPGVSLKRLTLEITDEPVTEGKIEQFRFFYGGS
ncbi:MAG: hypothetical protein R3B83_06000 [Nitrospirales bacterium]|nr:hypothetical protein [Nitrospirales bacterium]